jgi:thiamine-phosphate pyrophosphorylase
VGTQTSTDTEQSREDVSHVAGANAARVGEALRAIEEALKTLDPVAAKAVESIRYRFYDVERALLLSHRPAGRMEQVRLCVLITESICRRSWQETARLAIDGGADCLQLREKDLPAGELLARARAFVAICRERGVVSIINDRPDIALLCGADGVHVGQGDLPTLETRRLVGESMIVGTSTHSLAQAQQAKRDGADYVGIGPVFRSPTKPRDFVVSRQELADVARLPNLPALAIAGIDGSNLDEVLETGLRRIAVTRAVVSAEDPSAAARDLRRRLDAAGGVCDRLRGKAVGGGPQSVV